MWYDFSFSFQSYRSRYAREKRKELWVEMCVFSIPEPYGRSYIYGNFACYLKVISYHLEEINVRFYLWRYAAVGNRGTYVYGIFYDV
jgi:hypothetical protein